MKRAHRTLMALVLVLMPVVSANAGRPNQSRPEAITPAAIDNISYIGANNLQMLVSNVGNFAFDPSQHFGRTAGLYFPRGTDRTVIFSAGLWVGATVNNTPRVTVAEHTSEWGPGPMAEGTYTPDRGRFHVYKIDRGDNANTNPDYANWPWEDGAPHLLAADGSDSLDADGNLIPLVLGDQALWAVYNDADSKRHISDLGSTEPLGLEVKQYVFAFARSGALGNSIYLRYEIVNQGSNLLEDAYVSIWCDADVGDAFDDLVGCDTILGLGYAYNEGPDDTYGDEAPAVGFDFLQGPMVPSPGDEARLRGRTIADYRNLPMTTFSNYDNGVDPRNATESYNLMRGLGLDGEPVVDPDGNPTTFQFAGDPVTGDGWNDAHGDDRRFMMSSGPFTMAPGDTQEVVVAVLVGQGADHIGSITALKANDEQVQAVFDLDFIIPFPPPQPTVWSQPLPGQIELVWSRDAEGDVQESDILGQRFVMEGYNIYQGETKTGPWKCIATYDIDNDITRIYRDNFDSDIGAVQRVVTQSGSNSGLTNHLTIDIDRFTGRGLVDFNPYYFAITAYSYDELNVEEFQVGANVIGHLTEDLESRFEGIEIVPRSLAMELVDTAAHIEGGSEGMVIVRTLEPDSVVTSDYRVTFNEDLSWNLDNLTTDTRLLADQTNSTGDYSYELLEGIMVQVIGPEPDIKEVTWSGSEEPWVTSIPWGGRYFGEGLEMGAWFFGSSIQDGRDLVPVDIRFSPTNTQLAYRYIRGASPNYKFGGLCSVPLTAWDVSVDPPRQLNVCFVEKFGLASDDQTWLPPNEDPDNDGGREYLFILNSDYSEVENEYYTSRSIFYDGFDFDVLYVWWPLVAEGHTNDELAEGQVLSIDVNRYNAPEDEFGFRTTGTQEPAAAGVSLADVHPVPSPWIHGHNVLTGGRCEGISFVNLPQGQATVEIYSLAGELIATAQKGNVKDATILWDVQTSHGLPPASGLYIYRVIVPGIGDKIGKLAVFMEEERLRDF